MSDNGNGLPEVDDVLQAAYQQSIKLFGGTVDWQYEPQTGKFIRTDGTEYDFEFHPKTSVFITSLGITLHFNRYNQTFLQGWKERYINKHQPKMPQRPIEYETGKFYLEGNPKDPAFEQAMERFSANFNLEATYVLFSLAVKDETPAPENWTSSMTMFIEDIIGLDEKLSPYAEKFYWLMSLMPSNAEMLAFLHIVQGLDMPLVEDIEKAGARFPSHG